jgi:alpha-tubulin suppressor-like RCC1 family protein
MASGASALWLASLLVVLARPAAGAARPARRRLAAELPAAGQIEAGSIHSCWIDQGGGLSCWGDNSGGQLGDGTTNSTTAPAAVAGGMTWVQVSVGSSHTCGVKSDGGGYCWGYGGYGVLGDGFVEDRTAPTPVAGGATWAQLSAGYYHTCGITADGRALCWGWNADGQLGDGSTNEKLTPTEVAGGGTWSQISAAGGAAAEAAHTCGLRADGSAFCWGYNLDGRLGDGSRISKSVPTSVHGFAKWTSISAGPAHTCGLKASGPKVNDTLVYYGSAWCWGSNLYGGLGDGTRSPKATPFPVADSRRGYFQISAGSFYTCAVGLASDTRNVRDMKFGPDGSMRCWGSGAYGELGTGSKNKSYVPVEVLGGPWAQVAAGEVHTCGLDVEGRPYCWGLNKQGMLGDGTTATKYTPTAVVARAPTASGTAAALPPAALPPTISVPTTTGGNSAGLGSLLGGTLGAFAALSLLGKKVAALRVPHLDPALAAFCCSS